MITAKELRETLANIPDNTPIVLQKDDEGNGYRYMNGLDFSPPDDDEANFFNGEYDGECVRKADIDGGWGEPEDYPHLVAVAF